MKRTLLILAVFAALSMTVSPAGAQVRFSTGRSRDDTAFGISFWFGQPRTVYSPRTVYYHPQPRYQSYHPVPSHRAPYQPPVYRRSTYFPDPGPGGYWLSYYGGQAYRYGPYLYVPIRSWDGVRRYRRIWVGY